MTYVHVLTKNLAVTPLQKTKEVLYSAFLLAAIPGIIFELVDTTTRQQLVGSLGRQVVAAIIIGVASSFVYFLFSEKEDLEAHLMKGGIYAAITSRTLVLVAALGAFLGAILTDTIAVLVSLYNPLLAG